MAMMKCDHVVPSGTAIQTRLIQKANTMHVTIKRIRVRWVVAANGTKAMLIISVTIYNILIFNAVSLSGYRSLKLNIYCTAVKTPTISITNATAHLARLSHWVERTLALPIFSSAMPKTTVSTTQHICE